MAHKRMFTLQIVDSDVFLDMPSSSQALYFHLAMRADDDGFVNNPKKISKIVNSSDDDMRLLLAKKFIIGFESGVIVIKHWRMHNYIQKDRYKATNYSQEMALLSVDENNGYSLDTKCVQDVTSDKDRLELDKIRLDKDRDIMSPKGLITFCVDVVLYLNKKSNTNFRTGIKKTNSLIEARKKEGFTLDDFKTVIDKKSSQWLNDKKMSAYLRPETLFGTKFESYLNENVKADVNCWADSEVIDAEC